MMFTLANSIAVSMYLIGFVEALLDMLEQYVDGFTSILHAGTFINYFWDGSFFGPAILVLFYPPVSKVSREVTNLIKRKQNRLTTCFETCGKVSGIF